MAHHNCTICELALTDNLQCPACEAAEAIIAAGGALPHYHELLAEQIGNLMMQRDWLAQPINLKNLFPRFA